MSLKSELFSKTASHLCRMESSWKGFKSQFQQSEAQITGLPRASLLKVQTLNPKP